MSLAGLTVRLLVLLVALIIPVAASAETYWDFSYTVKSDGTLDITGYNGADDAVTIPPAIKGLPVTSIGRMVFYKCRSLKSVIIPESVTSIGEGAFGACPSLTDVTIPSGVTSIGEAAFFECGLTNIMIPRGVTSIRDDVFSGCTNLTSVTIPGNVTSLGKKAFSDCSRLASLTIQGGINGIGDSAFSGCTGLTGVTIPDSVTSIGSWSFSSCSSLVNFMIPKSVTNIGDRAFYKCAGLTGVYFQGNAPAVGSDAFLYSSTATIYYLKGTKGWNLQFGGRPTKWWKPQAQTNATSNSTPVVGVPSLTSGIWDSPRTNAPTGSPVQFDMPQDDNSYRIHVPPQKQSR